MSGKVNREKLRAVEMPVTNNTVSAKINGPSYKDLQHERVIESLPVAIYMCNKEGYIKSYNAAAVKLWGREPEIGKELWCGSWKMYTDKGRPLPAELGPIAISLKERRPVEGEEIIIERPDGTRRNVNPYPQLVFDEEGNLEGAINTLIDITDHKMAEEKTAHLAAIIHSSDDAIISKTLEGIVESWNDAAERIFGYKAEEMIGQSITKIIPPERLYEEPKILGKLKKGERIDHFETRRMTKDRRLLDVSLTTSPVKDSKGNIIGASKIARDITERKLIERQVRENEELFRMAVESTKLGTWEYSPPTGELNLSVVCRKIFGIPDNLKVDYAFFLRHIYPHDTGYVQTKLLKALNPSGNGDYDIVFRIVRHIDGETRWIRSQGKVFFDTDRRAKRFIGTALDITEEKNTKEALEKTVRERTSELSYLNEQLERSNQELEQYAYIASHDLQEPLRKIQTFAELLKKSIHDEEAFEKYYNKINLAAQRMSALINDVLNYSRLSQTNIKFVDIDLNQIMREVQTDLELLIERQQATICCSELPVVKGIPLQLQQLFSNLISNSIKFCEKAPEVSVSSRILSNSEIEINPN